MGTFDARPPVNEVDLVIVTLAFDAADQEALARVLAAYVVLTRREEGCRNVDLCAGAGPPGRFVVIEKWESPTHQSAHFDGPAMVSMASACQGLLTRAPQIELLESISAHDLA